MLRRGRSGIILSAGGFEAEMGKRSVWSWLLIAAGLLLCAVSVRHYARGWTAQREADALYRAARRPPENPGILRASSGSEGSTPSEGYPFGQPIAKLKIPSAKISYFVFGGADQEVLEKGPGHVPGTALPGEEGGANNCVITAHRDSHFRRLGTLRPGHRIDLETPFGEKSYRVVSREIVLPNAVRVLHPTEKPRLTLITCYPFNYIGPAPKRLVVVAEPR
jgi:sortase A